MRRYFFRLAFRKNLIVSRAMRAMEKQQILDMPRAEIGFGDRTVNVTRFVDNGYSYTQVWELTPRCGHVRLIGCKWLRFSAAVDSAVRLVARRAREWSREELRTTATKTNKSANS